MDTTTLIIVIVVLVVLFGGGGYYWSKTRVGATLQQTPITEKVKRAAKGPNSTQQLSTRG